MDKAGGRVLKVDPEPQVTGALLLSRVAFLRAQGSSALEEVLRGLGPADAAVLRGPLLPEAWFPLDLRRRVDEVIASVLSQHNRADVLVQLGRASADAILAGPGGLDANCGAPRRFLARVPSLYEAHHTAGRREYEGIGAHAAVVRTFCEPCSAASGDCWTILGWLQRGLELSGAEEVLVRQTSSRAEGGPACEFHCQWR
jgi:uncharacterized protein (TIGR02265 family)